MSTTTPTDAEIAANQAAYAEACANRAGIPLICWLELPAEGKAAMLALAQERDNRAYRVEHPATKKTQTTKKTPKKVEVTPEAKVPPAVQPELPVVRVKRYGTEAERRIARAETKRKSAAKHPMDAAQLARQRESKKRSAATRRKKARAVAAAEQDAMYARSGQEIPPVRLTNRGYRAKVEKKL
jgi:hypothetical protein